jgi:short-subunit dehydrogenase
MYDTHDQFFNELEPKPEVVISAVGLLGDQTVAEKDFISAKLVMDTNYTGVVSILNEVSSYFEVQGSGTIVGISSVAGERGRMKNYIYGSAKAAFTAYLSGLRQRLSKKGVHILSVQPGFVNTKMIEGLETPKRLTAEPEQVAKLIFNAYKKKKSVIFTPSYWRVIMTIIKLIPEKVFQRLQL